MDDERVEVVGKATGGGGKAGALELCDQGREPLLRVALVLGLIERGPVGAADPLAL